MKVSPVFMAKITTDHMEAGLWYYWCDIDAEHHGPFISAEIATQNYIAYNLYLGTSCSTGKCED